MKNLYIHQIENNGQYFKYTWEDVRMSNKGQIAKRKDYDYRIERGKYKHKDKLNKVVTHISYSEYITFKNGPLPKKTRNEMVKNFLEYLINKQSEIEYKMKKLNKFVEGEEDENRR
ncbi:hypothetical protein NL50_17970 [Clostridium acetobutylicum]|nr:hypothetical protein NL50_17970 [Clostridium acetobutylicum]